MESFAKTPGRARGRKAGRCNSRHESMLSGGMSWSARCVARDREAGFGTGFTPHLQGLGSEPRQHRCSRGGCYLADDKREFSAYSTASLAIQDPQCYPTIAPPPGTRDMTPKPDKLAPSRWTKTAPMRALAAIMERLGVSGWGGSHSPQREAPDSIAPDQYRH